MKNQNPNRPADIKKNTPSTPSADAGTPPDHQDFHEQDPETLPYWNDPDFQKILSAYQKAKWDFCLKGIDQFRRLYPEDKYLSSFGKEIELRSNLQLKRKKQRGKENLAEFGKKGGWIISIFIMVVVTGFSFFQSQNRINKVQQTIEASNLIYSLDKKYQDAENFMQAGKPGEALLLYKEIQQVNPSYNEIEIKIEQAEAANTVENLYHQGIQKQTAGDLDPALTIFIEVNSLSPGYKDAVSRINQIKLQEIDILEKSMKDAYSTQDWMAVAIAYESIQQLDPNFAASEDEKELLFISLQNLVIRTLNKESMSGEEIESAVRYYQQANAVYPQDKNFTEEQEDLQKTATDLLINKYYVYAENTLEESNYNFQSITQAIQILSQVESISAGSETINKDFTKIQLFLNSYNQFMDKEYDLAIQGLEELRKIDANYAGPKVKYLLYESYLAYGDILYKNADYPGARDQYQKSEKYAWTDSEHILRVFLVELKVAEVLNQLGAPTDAAAYYQYAFEQIHFRQYLLDSGNQELLTLIDNADSAFTNKQMGDSITFFEKAVEQKEKLFDYETEKVFQGEALPDIAFQYGCTIEILKSVNMLGDGLIIQADQDLQVPIY